MERMMTPRLIDLLIPFIFTSIAFVSLFFIKPPSRIFPLRKPLLAVIPFVMVFQILSVQGEIGQIASAHEYVDAANQYLPQNLSSYYAQQKIVLKPEGLLFSFTYTGAPTSPMDIDIKNRANHFLRDICNDTRVTRLLQGGMNASYQVYSSKGLLLDRRLTPASCQGQPN